MVGDSEKVWGGSGEAEEVLRRRGTEKKQQALEASSLDN
jgi:hypothetical protein